MTIQPRRSEGHSDGSGLDISDSQVTHHAMLSTRMFQCHIKDAPAVVNGKFYLVLVGAKHDTDSSVRPRMPCMKVARHGGRTAHDVTTIKFHVFKLHKLCADEVLGRFKIFECIKMMRFIGVIPVFEKGINLSVVLDGSESMSASDYNPTRLDAAKDAISKLVTKIGPQNNVGVVLFESGATTISYLSPDKQKTINAVSSIQQGQGATAIGDGLSLGIDMSSSIPDKKSIVILLSDGVHNSGFVTPDEAIAYAKANNVQIHTIGLGSVEPVYLRDDIYGEPQYAELDEETLMKIFIYDIENDLLCKRKKTYRRYKPQTCYNKEQ